MSSAEDYIRRCSGEEEAFEIIEYHRDREEITDDETDQLRRQLEEEGLRNFGPKKELGFYKREG